MRNVRLALTAAALGALALGTTAANASSKPLPPPPAPGENVIEYVCTTIDYLGVEIACDDIACGPRSCDTIVGDRAR